MNPLLIVGGAGYIGSHVALEFLNQGYSVTVFDNLSTGTKENLPPEVTFIEGDIADEAALTELFKTSFSGVVHLAALKASGQSMREPELYAKNNISHSLNLLEFIANSGVQNLVFSSSAAVYGEPEYLPIDEKHPTNPSNFYGFTKLTIEGMLKWLHQIRGLNFAALRYFNASGYDQTGRINGVEFDSANLLPNIMDVATGKKEKLSVFGDDYNTPDGTCLRDYVHVSDIAKAHVKAFEYIQKNNKPLTVNLGIGKGYSVLEIIKMVEQVSGRTINYDLFPRRIGDLDELIAKVGLAQQELGWEAKESDLETIISSHWKQYERLFMNKTP